MNNEMDGMAVGTYDDPLVIRLYLHMIRNDDGSGGVSALNLQEQIDYLDLVYNQLNIYLDYCIIDFPCTQCLTDLSFLKNQWVTNSLDDGMNGYLLPVSSPLPGEAGDVPSKNFYARISPLNIAAHEFGHGLGLYHTHQDGACPPTVNTEYAPTWVASVLTPGSNSSIAGDRITDTPADPRYCYNMNGPNCTFINPLHTLDYLGNQFIDPNNVLPVNLMSYNTCAGTGELTPGQNNRIRDVLVFSEELAEVISPFSHIKLVTGTEVWSSPLFFDHDVNVEGNLTISTEVGFAPGFGLIIEKDGYLLLDGATLTLSSIENSCNNSTSKFWNGISIKRDNSSRGFLEMKNSSVIEHADQAISFVGAGWQWVIADDCIFRNNRISFNNIQSTGGPAKFTLCDFVIDDDYLGSSYYPQVNSVHSYLTWFRGCQFIFEPVLISSITRQAISSYDGQIVVQAGPGPTRSKFDNWSRGITAAGNMDTKLVLVRGSDFTGNQYGIFSDQFWKIYVYDNQFDISNDDISENGWGIYTSQARSIQLHDNKFWSENSSVNSTGIHVDNTFGENLAISESDFTDLDVGIDAVSAGNEARGLMLLCNQNEGNRDFDFKTANGIGPRQGSNVKPAGNTFSHTGVESASDFSATGISYFINYFHSPGVSIEIPLYKTSNVNPIAAQNSHGCEHFALFQDPYDNDDLADYISHHTDILAEIEDKEDELDQPHLTAEQIRDLSADLQLLELDRDMNISDAISYVLVQDSLIYNDLREAIDLKNDFKSEISLALTWLDEGKYAEALSQLESVGARVDLDVDEEQDLEEIIELNSMLVNVYRDARIENMLTEEEMDTVELIAENGIGLGRNQARALLCYFYDNCISLDVEEFQGKPNISNETIEPSDLVAWPSPAKDEIEVQIPVNNFIGILNVTNIEGKVMLSQIIQHHNDNPVTLNTNQFPLGVYFINMYGGESKVFIGRFIK
jgi:hypothetical protein